MNAVTDNPYSRFLAALGGKILRENGTPEAVVVFSAHWQTRGTRITGNGAPPQIYDFYGFPEELYRLRYEPSGAPGVAAAISAGVPGITVDPERGIDHAAWAVMKHVFPAGDVPVLEMSLDVELSFGAHAELGRKIAALGLSKVLFIGSGNLVHNLREVDFGASAPPFPWASEANRWLGERIAAGDREAFIGAERGMPGFSRAAPTTEHFIPALYILGMTEGSLSVEYDEIQNGSVSMLAFSGK